MSISGYLLPFPDPGAADLMSDHLEQMVQAAGPGKIFVATALPASMNIGFENPSGSGGQSARKKLEFFRLEESEWVFLYGTTVDGGPEPGIVVLDVDAAGTIRCKLTNISGKEGQFFLECIYESVEAQQIPFDDPSCA